MVSGTAAISPLASPPPVSGSGRPRPTSRRRTARRWPGPARAQRGEARSEPACDGGRCVAPAARTPKSAPAASRRRRDGLPATRRRCLAPTAAAVVSSARRICRCTPGRQASRREAAGLQRAAPPCRRTEIAVISGVLFRDFSRRRDDVTVVVAKDRPPLGGEAAVFTQTVAIFLAARRHAAAHIRLRPKVPAEMLGFLRNCE